jgi:hypothetical protein
MKTLTCAIFVFAFMMGCAVPPDSGYVGRVLNDPQFWQGWQLVNQPSLVRTPIMQPSINCTTIFQGRNAYTSC